MSHADARAFLTHVETAERDGDGPPPRHFLTAAYFREIEPVTEPPRLAADLDDDPLSKLMATEQASPPLPPAGASAFREALGRLSPEVRDQRLAELVYLANVLVASGRGYDPLSATQAVFEACAAGLHSHSHGTAPVATLTQHGADQLFVLGWRRNL